MRSNRKRIARLAIKTLAPLLKATPPTLATATSPSHRILEVQGLTVTLTEQVLPKPTDSALVSILDIWPVKGHKMLSVAFEPLEIIGFHEGNWIEVVTDLAYQASGEAERDKRL